MKTTENDRIWKEMMKEIRLESPGPGFSDKVMETVRSEAVISTSIQDEPLLGKRFWIFVSLFVLLAVVVVIFYGNGNIQDNNQFQQFLPELPSLNLKPVEIFLSSVSVNTGSLLWTILLVTGGASLLILADKYFNNRHKIALEI